MSFLKNRPLWSSILLITALSLFALLCLLFLAKGVKDLSAWETIWRYRAVFFQGWIETVMISMFALVLSSLFGALIVTARRSSFYLLSSLSFVLVELIRGTPLLTQILLFFYVVAHGLGLENRVLVGVLILSLFSSAYTAEMIRGGIEAIPQSQWESAKVLGLTRFQTYRYVILPQVFHRLVPALTGQLASLIKDSSLLSIIGISELTMAAQQVNAATYATLESYFPLACGYLLLTLPLSLGSRWLEKKLAL
jgi:polar amino acid transport system permease protein